jgi:hypothetical protein
METYEKGDHAYHYTLPKDAIFKFHSAMKETEAFSFDRIRFESSQLVQ